MTQNFGSGSTVTVASLTEDDPLTAQERDRLAYEALEKKIAAKIESRRRLMVLGEKADRLKTQVDDLVEQLLAKLDSVDGSRAWGDVTISSSSGTATAHSPYRNFLKCIAEHTTGIYGCGEVYAGLEAELKLLRKAVASLDTMEGNPLSANGEFRQDAHRLAGELAQFVEKVSSWSRYCLECLSDHREGILKQ